MDISSQLINWYLKNKRDLPWRHTQDPYKIWLSEIILQQTRIEQGLKYYLHFTQKYPTVNDLAKAKLDEVLKDWEGLGYYSRARNLHFTANFVMTDLQGVFPNAYSELIKLKGVGTYTAAAIASFSNKEKKAVVDGNVYRFLGRYFDIDSPIDMATGKKLYQEIADSIISEQRPDLHNQAIMEFGATYCTNHNPKCSSCFFNQDCKGFRNGTINQRPVKKKKIKVVDRFLNFYFINSPEGFLIEQRNEKGIWHKLYQFPLHESDNLEDHISHQPQLDHLMKVDILDISKVETLTHLLSHQKLHIQFWRIDTKHIKTSSKYDLISYNEIKNKAFPKPVQAFLQKEIQPKSTLIFN